MFTLNIRFRICPDRAYRKPNVMKNFRYFIITLTNLCKNNCSFRWNILLRTCPDRAYRKLNVEKTTETVCILWPVPAFGWAPVNKNIRNKSSPRFVDGFNEPHVFIREDEIKDLHMFKGMLCCYLLLIIAKILFVSMSTKPIWKDKNHQLDSNQNMKKNHVWVAIHSLTDKYNV